MNCFGNDWKNKFHEADKKFKKKKFILFFCLFVFLPVVIIGNIFSFVAGAM